MDINLITKVFLPETISTSETQSNKTLEKKKNIHEKEKRKPLPIYLKCVRFRNIRVKNNAAEPTVCSNLKSIHAIQAAFESTKQHKFII